MLFRGLILSTLLLTISGCGNLGFRDSGPNRAFNPDSVAEIEPRIEPRSRGGNPASYRVLGKSYRVLQSNAGFIQRGGASWYGTKFHGRKTSNGERYDMYAISAAHKTLPIPTYLRVTNLENGRQLIVRVNDRGPFHSDRIIDLSYAAAAKLGYAKKGTTQVEIRTINVAQYQREKYRTTPTVAPVQVTATPLQQPVIPIEAKATALPTVAYTEHAAKPKTVPNAVPTSKSTATLTPKSTQKSDGIQQIYIQLGAFSNRTNANNLLNKTAQAQIKQMGTARIQTVINNSKMIYRVRLGPFNNETVAAQIVQQLIQNNIGQPRIFHDS